MVNRITKCIGIVAAIGITSEIIYQAYLWILRKRTETESRNESSITEVLFFPDRMVACKDYFIGEHGCTNLRCRFTHEPNSLSSLYKHLSGARTSLDVCVFVICCADLGDVIINAHRRGVKVRVICDDEQVDISGSQIWRMRSEGINVRTDSSSYLMHHKFVLINRDILINGSFNWTRQAISGNQENLLITNNKKLVNSYLQEFEKLWLQFEPGK